MQEFYTFVNDFFENFTLLRRTFVVSATLLRRTFLKIPHCYEPKKVASAYYFLLLCYFVTQDRGLTT